MRKLPIINKQMKIYGLPRKWKNNVDHRKKEKKSARSSSNPRIFIVCPLEPILQSALIPQKHLIAGLSPGELPATLGNISASEGYRGIELKTGEPTRQFCLRVS